MATKAQLEAEVAELKRQLAEQQTQREEAKPEASNSEDDAGGAGILEELGIKGDDMQALWEQFSEELGGFPERKPLLTMIGVFAAGFLLGRAGGRH